MGLHWAQHSVWVAALLLLTTATFSCGGSKAGIKAPADAASQHPANANGAGNSGKDGAAQKCTKEDCPPASMDVASAGFSNTGALVGYVDEPVPWDFKGVDLKAGTGRKVGVLLDDVPEGSKITPELDGSQVFTEIKLDWTPDRKMKSSVNLAIILRDLSRCEVMEENPKKCYANKLLKEYDKKVSVPWEIVNKGEATAGGVSNPGGGTGSGSSSGNSTVTVSNPNCGPNPTTDSDITSKVLQGGIQAISGGGGDLIKTLGSILGSAGGLSGGGGTTSSPTEC